MNKKSFSWVIIIIMFYLFFPVGIWMLVKKMTTEKWNYFKNGKSLRIFGWVLIGFAVLYLIMGLTGELAVEEGTSIISSLVLILILFGGGGLFSLYKASSYIKLGTEYANDDSNFMEEHPEIVPEVIKCECCGATNNIYPGKAKKCEYCDSPL